MVDIDILLAYGANYKKVRKGEIVFTEGSKAYFYYQLVEGHIRWLNVDDDGRECIQYIISPGQCFGEIPMFNDDEYVSTAIAEEDCLLLRLLKPSFLQLLKDQPDIHFKFSSLLAERLRFKFMLVRELSSNSPQHRITALLNYMKDHQMNYCPNCHKVLITRQQLANMTGLRVETVIRVIKDLEEKKIVSINKGKVYC
jgi:CRP-like cAMP-binding protein